MGYRQKAGKLDGPGKGAARRPIPSASLLNDRRIPPIGYVTGAHKIVQSESKAAQNCGAATPG